MQEYNWRKEREKFRPGFQKTEQAPPPEPTPEPNKPSGGSRAVPVILMILAAVLVVVLIVVFSTMRSSKSASASGDTAALLAQAADNCKSAVGLVVVTVELSNGNKIEEPIGTAWAFAENKFATNAHVAEGIKEAVSEVKNLFAQEILKGILKDENCASMGDLIKKLGEQKVALLLEAAIVEAGKKIRKAGASILINGSHRESYPVTQVQLHREYGVVNTDFDPDVAVLTIQGRHDNFFKVADSESLKTLKSGEPIAFLGFPMERLAGNNVNVDNPVASMQSGIVVAVSDFSMKDVGGAGNYLIRHNLPSAGGASGSPIFNRNGEVIALLYGGNATRLVNQGKSMRMPSAAQINFGVRVDLLSGVGTPVALEDFLRQ